MSSNHQLNKDLAFKPGHIKEPNNSSAVKESFGANLIPWFLSKFGLLFCHLVLPIPVFFYYVFGGERRKAIGEFYNALYPDQKRLNQIRAFWNYFYFGMSLIDRIALRSKQTIDFVTMDPKDLPTPGSIFIGAHFGDWFCSALALSQQSSAKVALVMDLTQTPKFREMIQAIGDDKVQFIDFSCPKAEFALTIKKAVDEGRFISFLGDRYYKNQKGIDHQFLGKTRTFPVSPFYLALILKCPVHTLFSLKSGKKGKDQYRVHCHKLFDGLEKVSAVEISKRYVTKLEELVKEHPHQWFNFYRFWNKETNINSQDI
jgi:predicted LPLAT superfamily acyltransferase